MVNGQLMVDPEPLTKENFLNTTRPSLNICERSSTVEGSSTRPIIVKNLNSDLDLEINTRQQTSKASRQK